MNDKDLKVLAMCTTNQHKAKVIEELSELSQAIAKELATGECNIDNIFSETADVFNMIDRLCLIYKFDKSDIQKLADDKLDKAIRKSELKGTDYDS